MKEVKYFRYSSFGPVTLYTGHMGSGLTLGAIIRIVKTSITKNPPIIVSNVTLFGLDYKKMDPKDINTYLESPHLLLFDSGYQYFSSRRSRSKENAAGIYLFSQLRKSNSKAILTTSHPDIIDKRIGALITDIVKVSSNFPRHQKLTLSHYKMIMKDVMDKGIPCTAIAPELVSRCVVKRSGKYWKYYNTQEIPVKIGT